MDNTWDFLGAHPELQQQDMLRQQMAEALMRQQPAPDGSVQSRSFNDAIAAQGEAFQQMPAGRSIGGPVQEDLRGRQFNPNMMGIQGQLRARPDYSVPGVEMHITPQPKFPMRGFR